MEVIPAIDILDGQVVRLARGSYDAVTRYGEDPAAQLRAWGSLGADLVHVVDLGAARSGVRDGALAQELGASGVRFQLGGGIRTAADAVAVLEAGAERVVVGTAAVWSPAALRAILDAAGPARVVAALDVLGGRARGAGWLDDGVAVAEVSSRLADQGVVRALVTGIGGDGMMTGPDLEVLATVRAAAPSMALIGSGGVGALEDLAALRLAGAEAAVVGRALYESRFSLADAIAVAAQSDV